MKKIYNLNYIKIASIYLIIFCATLIIFYDHEPGIDQIRHISWAKDLINSTFFFDFNKISLEEIRNQNKSILVNLIKPAYSDIGHLFNLFPIIIISILGYLFGNIVLFFNLISITFFVGNIILVKIIYEKFFNKIIDNFSIFLFFSLIFSSYYFFYAPLGVHNIALFFNLLVIYYLKANDNNWSIKKLFNLIVIITLGIYSHKINAVLIPPSVFMYFLINKNFNILLKYLLIQLFFLLPFFLIIFLFPETLKSTKEFAQIDISLTNYISNFLIWFKNINFTIGLIPLIFFIVGFYFVKKNKNNCSIIFIFIFTHIFCYIFINSFSIYYIRTNLYINYLVLILSFYSFLNLSKISNFKLSSFILVILTIHIFYNINNIYLFFSKDNFGIYNKYFNNNGKIKISLNNIDKYLPNNKKIIFLDNKVHDYFKIYREDKIYNKSIIKKPLKNISYKKQDINKFLNDKSIENIIIISLTNDKFEVIKYVNLVSELSKFSCDLKIQKIKSFNKVGPNDENLEINEIVCN